MSISVQTSPLCLRNTTAQLSSIFLAPNSLPTFPAILQISKFSTTTALSARQKPHKKRRHGNPHRGESALRRTGLRYPVGMSKEPLPQPVLDPKRRSKIEGDPNHGLWGFFNSKKKLFTPIKEESAFGRPWSVEELRPKSWEDLHSLWYICCKENNRMATENRERIRLNIAGGSGPAKKRALAIRRTQQCIKHTLTERWYSWEAAWKVAEKDPEVDLNAKPDTSAYTPIEQEDEEIMGEEAPRAASAAG